MSINNTTLVGRLARDLNIIENANGSKTVLMTIAVNRSYKNSEGKVDADFIQVKAFIQPNAKTNGPFDYMEKGQLIGVDAELRSTKFEKDGKTVYGMDVIVKHNGVHLLERGKKAGQAPAEELPEDVAVMADEELPFM